MNKGYIQIVDNETDAKRYLQSILKDLLDGSMSFSEIDNKVFIPWTIDHFTRLGFSNSIIDVVRRGLFIEDIIEIYGENSTHVNKIMTQMLEMLNY